MSRSLQHLQNPFVVLPHRAAALTRRRFLVSLAALGGAAVAAPLFSRSRGAARVDVTRPLLGTWVRVVARHEDEAMAGRAVERAFAAFRRVDAEMSIHRRDSEIARVNAQAGGAPVAVGAALLQVASLARQAARRSDGVYDPTVLPLLRVFGFYGGSATRYPDDRAIARAAERVDHRQLAIDPDAGTLGLGRAGGLDLGSIGKGWAVDRAVAALREQGVRDGLVDAGGNVYGLGVPEPGAEGWSVGVLHPATRQVDRLFVLRDAAIATSGNAEQFRVLGGLRVGHLFDARSGRPADGHLSVTVLARDATWADLLSTSAYLLGPDRFHWPEAVATHFVG